MGNAAILHLTLKRQWFDAIANGTKSVEYRAMTDYWATRLERRHYDEIHFRNGYSVHVPFMRVECLGLDIAERHGQVMYAIRLGRVLELRNYPAIVRAH